jgi:hypothetical protein
MNKTNNLKVDLVLRQKQQRLLLLEHASKCEEPEGFCIATRHCTEMKKLWNHVKVCKDKSCLTIYCVSSRVVLSHYYECNDGLCNICNPVRKRIKRFAILRKELMKQKEFETKFEEQLRLQLKQQIN